MGNETIVLGCGNLLAADDGVGIRAVEILQSYPLPPGTVVKAVGTPGLDLINHFQGYQRALIVDAVQSGGTPGTIYRIPGDDLVHFQHLTPSGHHLGLSQVLALSRLTLGTDYPREVVVFGLEVEDTEPFTLQLSRTAQAGLPILVEAIREELHKGTENRTNF